jgi:hypothetical protein
LLLQFYSLLFLALKNIILYQLSMAIKVITLIWLGVEESLALSATEMTFL